MALEIQVVSASNLQNLETLGKSDPYVTVIFQGDKKKTEVKSSTLDPVWEETLRWELSSKAPRPDECIDITVKDYERMTRNRLLGKATIALRNVVHAAPGTPLDYELGLLDATDSPTVGTLKLIVSYTPPAGAKKGGMAGGTAGSMAGGGRGVGAIAARTAAATSTLSDGISPMPDVGVEGTAEGMPAMPQQRNRDRLSNVKTDFQVRVRVVEGRQLLGANMNPVSRVTLDGQTRQTRVHKGTNSPWFDEIFFFQAEQIPTEFLEKFLEFKVCNSSGIRSATTIGAFKCEVGMVYDQADHAILNRWLVLADPDEATPTVQGYLKVSVAVLGPGDMCPDMTAQQSEQDDVEANLLWSAGVHLQPATFVLSVFCAQNLPQMDAGTMQTLKEVLGVGTPSKELVDPYLVASYAGREVQTKILYTNENPEFRQNLHMGFLFPSMCNVIKIVLKDWDRVGEDDLIGTATIPVSAISAPGEDGYLPTFGPSWVNVYGTRREWELMEGDSSKKMNKGQDKGCAYRGRVLLSLHTKVGSYPPAPTTAIGNDEFNTVRRFRGTRKFVVLCHLSGAWLLDSAEKPVEVEVSMGNFGNKLENKMIPSPSSTHPANPVFDGCKYYFLPWSGVEPFVTIHCDFEDVTHRLHSVNHIISIINVVKKDLDALHSLLRGNQEDKEVVEGVSGALSRLIEACSLELPEVDPIRHAETSLDIHLRARRRRELDEVKKAMQGLDAKDPKSVIGELESVLSRLENLAVEPQSSMPDVFLWLMSGTRRLAYVRIPAHSILHAHQPTAQGMLSGKFNTYALTNPDGDESRWGLGGVVRGSVWLGREEDVRTWWESRPDLQLTVYAETYENQVTVPGSGKWNDSGLLLTRPKFSDADGLLNLPRENFAAPDGWVFQGDWIVAPDPSVMFAADAGRRLFTEEVFEQQVRLPGGAWVPAPSSWTDARNDPATSRDDIGLPEGWAWRDLWSYDLQRAVDGEGWEFTVESGGLVGWSPQEKIYHTRRRRRWIRERHLVDKVEKKETMPVDGWEYAPLFRLQFHAIERKVDMVRRRRWRRRLVPSEPGLPPTPRLSIMTGKGDEKYSQLTCPRMYLLSAERHLYQLRAHIYQARDLIPGDKTGLADPYAVVSFCNGTQQTEKQMKTLCPTWDQTLIFDDVQLTGRVDDAVFQAPKVVVEVFDWDARGAPEYLGRVFCRPSVVVPSSGYKPLPLQWHQLSQGNDKQGELLASFELLLKDGEEELPMLPPTRHGGDLYMVPFGVRPLLQRTRVEILCWGVRNMATYELQSVTRPSIEFECGGERIISPTMKNLRINPNFDKPHLVFDVELPKEALYLPPLTLRVVDHRAFGSKPVVATAVVSDLQRYTVEPKAARRKRKGKKSLLNQRDSLALNSLTALDSKTVIDKEPHHRPTPSHAQASREPGTVDVDIDWWAKYYASSGQLERAGSYLSKGYEKLDVLYGTLEEETRFSGFTDMIDTVPLFRGRGDKAQLAGEFKGTFRMYSLSSDEPEEPPLILAGYPTSELQEVVARVYVVMGQDLAPKDAGCSSDPYVVVKLGKNSKSSKDDYRPNTLNPFFGHVFEVTGTLPLHKDLTVQVWDYDLISSDDLIGETVIDLENRYLTRHRATVGLPKQYHVSGSNMWRDVELPSEILAKVARERNLEGPLWHQQPFSLTLGGTTYTLTEFEHPDVVLPPTVGNSRERLALHVLHKAVPLVPEHVENRPLMHPAHPGIPQGQLKLWVDLFPSSVSGPNLPPPIDITPRQPHKYLLRVAVFNVFEAPLQETSAIGGEKMSDVYVKGWLQGTNNVQKTDTHYRCMDGEANFNWRFVYPLEMLEAEQVMLVEYKEHPWSMSSTQQRRPPQLTLQLWDNDLILRDDYLSEMTLDLCHLPKPAKSVRGVGPAQVPEMMGNGTSSSVTISFLDDHSSSINLFEAKRVYGYFPFTRVEDGVTEIAGKIEMELEVVTEEESKLRPAGQGRDEPNMNPKLPEPNRPATSFLWLTSPWKSFKHILWKNYKWYCITLIILFILFLFLFLFLYSFPGATVEYLLGTY